MSDPILCVGEGGVTAITLNRPEDGNRVSDDMAVEMTAMIAAAENNSRLIVLRGAGDDFCLGRAGMGQRSGPPPEALEYRNRIETVFDFYAAFRGARIPVIGVVQGRAAGFGCAIAALCDITLAAADATFQLPEMGHNIMPTMAMSALVDRVPRKALVYLTYSTAAVDAERALTFGIASDIFAASELDRAADALVAALLAMPDAATRAVKEYARSAPSMDISGATDFARNLHATVNTSGGMRG